jgi:hypothetical protein
VSPKGFQIVIPGEARNPERFPARNPAGFAYVPFIFMASIPSPTPLQILQRVLTVAAFHGRFQLIVGACVALLSAIGQGVGGAILGCLFAGAGALQIHARTQLRHGDFNGYRWLVRSQLLLFAAVLIVSAVQLTRFDPAIVEQMKFTQEQLDTMKQINVTPEQFTRMAWVLSYILLSGFSFVYQGAFALYYRLKHDPIQQAIAEDRSQPETPLP